jgi:DNA repair exonuclease SbcCD ATPase subunit
MKIKEISWKNFGSYGNRLQTIQFDDNAGAFYVVLGQNGSGKSTISDVIKYGLYGKLDNKRNRDIPNRFNGNMYVKVVVEKRPGLEAVIERGIAPNFFRVYINGKEYDQAGKRNTQEFLEEEILGIPYYIFNNIVSLSINDFKSFLGMTPNDKRQIIDRLFGLELLGQLRWYVKEHIKSIREGISGIDAEIAVLQSTIEKSTEELDSLHERLKTANTERAAELKEAIQKVKEYVEAANTRIREISEKEKSARESLESLTSSLSGKRYDLKRFKELEQLYQNDCCPTCKGSLKTDFHKSALLETQQDLKNVGDEITLLESSQARLRETQSKISKLKEETLSKKTNAESKLGAYQIELKKLTGEQVSDEQSGSLKRIIDDSQKRKDEAVKTKDVKESLSNFYKIVEEIFGDRGVKLSAVRRIVPVLNQEIRKVLIDLSVDYRVSFEEDFSVKITQTGYDIAVEQLSTGERKKIDFAVIIALIRIMKIKFHGLNLIFLDEIFSSIDSDGIWNILGVLSKTSKELKLHTFVINHSPLPAEIFDYRVEIEKKNGFSDIKLESIV